MGEGGWEGELEGQIVCYSHISGYRVHIGSTYRVYYCILHTIKTVLRISIVLEIIAIEFL